jgi:DNA-binding beta-propeller fold protein YncE
VKQAIEREIGILPRDAHLFVHNTTREEELVNEELVASLRRGEGKKVEMSLLVEQADAQEVIPALAANAEVVLGAAGAIGLERLNNAMAVAFVPAHPDWVVLSEYGGNRIRINNIRTGALVCKFGESGAGEGQFYGPRGVAILSDGSTMLVVDCQNHRVQVLRLVAHIDNTGAYLEFVREFGGGGGSNEGQLLCPMGMGLLQGDSGPETVLVAEQANHRVSHFKLDGTFICIFAGTGKEGSGDGEFAYPRGIAVLSPTGEVAVVDYNNHRIQIFDAGGGYKRQFGSKGKELDGHLHCPTGVTSDVHGNLLVTDLTDRLQVFSLEGSHLCTRNDLGLNPRDAKGVAWNSAGGVAVANGGLNNALLWGTRSRAAWR